MSSRTTYLSRLLGCWAVLVGLAMMMHKQAMVEMMKELADSSVAMYLAGLIAIAVGLAMVLGHNVWRGGALPVVVTVMGWWSLIKGLLCLFLPQGAIAGLLGGLVYEHYYYLSPAITLLLGLYLIYASSIANRERAAVK
jgi:hypothetical protein